MSNYAGIQNARGRGKRVSGRFSMGRMKLSHHQIGYSKWRDVGMGACGEGSSGRVSGWQDLAAAHHGGISTKIFSPQATEGGGRGGGPVGGG